MISKYDEYFQKYAAQYWAVDMEQDPDFWHWFAAQCKAESNFNPNAVSVVGAAGLMQFMKPTWSEMQSAIGVQDRLDPEQSIKAGIYYDRWIFNRLLGYTASFVSWPTWNQLYCVFAAYNWGIGNVRRVIKAMGSEFRLSWIEAEIKPQETRDYCDRIFRYHRDFLVA